MERLLIILLSVAIIVVTVTLNSQKAAAETKYQEIITQLTAAKEEHAAYEKMMQDRFGEIIGLDEEKAKLRAEIDGLNKGKATLSAQLKALGEAIQARQS